MINDLALIFAGPLAGLSFFGALFFFSLAAGSGGAILDGTGDGGSPSADSPESLTFVFTFILCGEIIVAISLSNFVISCYVKEREDELRKGGA